MNRFEKIRKLQEKLKADIRAIGKEGIREFFTTIFTAHPNIEKIRWNQYTPYFNDGDACVFRVNEPEIQLKGIKTGGYNADGWLSSDNFQHYDDETAKRKAFVDAIPTITWDFVLPDAAILEQIFGDHTEITVNRDGTVTQEDYEHD